MENKLILFGIFYALLHATSTKGVDPDSFLDGGPFTIYIDAGKDIESLSSLAKTIEGKQSLIDDELNKMQKYFQKIEALEKRMTTEAKETEEKWNQRMAAEAKESEERWFQRMTAEAKKTEERWKQRMAAETQATKEKWKDENYRMSEEIKATERRLSAEITRLNQKVVELSNQLSKSRDIASTQKRPAELACKKITNDLRSVHEMDFNFIPINYMYIYSANNKINTFHATLIDRRFVITTPKWLDTHKYTKINVNYSDRKIGIKAVHIHPEYSPERISLNNIGLIELESDVEYSRQRYPLCLYATQLNPGSHLTTVYGRVLILEDAECFNKTGTGLKPSQICVKSLEYSTFNSDEPIYIVHENIPKYQLFGIVAMESSNFEPFVITKVFDYLNFIESIVWAKSGN